MNKLYFRKTIQLLTSNEHAFNSATNYPATMPLITQCGDPGVLILHINELANENTNITLWNTFYLRIFSLGGSGVDELRSVFGDKLDESFLVELLQGPLGKGTTDL